MKCVANMWCVVVLAFALFCSGACKKREGQGMGVSEYLSVVEKYVEREKGWKVNEYEVAYNRIEDGLLVFDVIFKDDLDLNHPGGGESIEAHLDPREGKVKFELAFQ